MRFADRGVQLTGYRNDAGMKPSNLAGTSCERPANTQAEGEEARERGGQGRVVFKRPCSVTKRPGALRPSTGSRIRSLARSRGWSRHLIAAAYHEPSSSSPRRVRTAFSYAAS